MHLSFPATTKLLIVAAFLAPVVAQSTEIATPAGLHVGDQFRIAFITNTQTAATSSDISTYNSIITTELTGITYGGVQVTGHVIASTVAVGVYSNIQGHDVNDDPVYLIDGTQVAIGTSTIQGLIAGNLSAAINKTLANVSLAATNVWTGMPTGNQGPDRPHSKLGQATGIVLLGNSAYSDYRAFDYDLASSSETHPLYGLTDVLTVPSPSSNSVPEPSTAALSLLGLGLFRRHAQRRKV